MNKTDPYGFPYPECDPPLIKDSSQIVQMRDLAIAVDTEVERVVTKLDDNLAHPPSGRLTIAVTPVATTDPLVTVDFDTQVFSVNGGFFLTFSGGFQIVKAGWWLMGGHALVSSATATVSPMVRLVVNGVPASSWSFPAGNYGVSNSRLAALSAVPLLLAVDDVVHLQIKHLAAGSPAWDYRPHLWGTRLIAA
ncbi:hypothetical protein [Streptomyces wedmorensis]